MSHYRRLGVNGPPSELPFGWVVSERDPPKASSALQKGHSRPRPPARTTPSPAVPNAVRAGEAQTGASPGERAELGSTRRTGASAGVTATTEAPAPSAARNTDDERPRALAPRGLGEAT